MLIKFIDFHEARIWQFYFCIGQISVQSLGMLTVEEAPPLD